MQLRPRARYLVTVTALVCQVMLSGAVTGTASVPPIADAGTEVYVIPSSAHAPGVANTNWVSDVVVHNPNDVEVTAAIYFMKVGQDNSAAAGHEVVVGAGQSVVFADIIEDTFGESATSGALLVAAPRLVVVTSRTFNDAASGTYGQYIPGLHVLAGLGRNEEARLLQLAKNETYRTNIGFANMTGSVLNVFADLYKADGTKLGSRGYAIQPWGYFQENDIIGKVTADAIDDAYAVVKAVSSGAKYLTYASVIDNRTGDPICIIPVEPGGSTDPVYVPGSAHQSGVAGTNWRTDLEVLNPGADPVDFSVELLKRDQANPSPESHSFSLGPALALRSADILESVFGFSGSATLRVTPTAGSLMATSRTYNDQPTGTYGQFVPGVPLGSAITPGREAILVQLSQSVVAGEGFRTNLGLVSGSATPTFVKVELHTSAGALLGSKTYGLEGFKSTQISEIFKQVTTQAVDNGFAVVSTTTAGARVFAYASVVDNRSGDPIYIPAQMPFALCTYEVSPEEAAVAAAGEAVAVTVGTNAGSCPWSATSEAEWVTPDPAIGLGSGTVTLTVAANVGPEREATVDVAGVAVALTQASGCTFSLDPASAQVAAAGGTGSTQVTSSASTCPWTATSSVAWLTITSGASGKGDGTVAYAVAANTGVVPRTGTLTLGGATLTVTQAAAPGLPSIEFTLPGDVPLVALKVPAGTFSMGSPGAEQGRDPDEGPRHEVTLTDAFYLGKLEVTQRQWIAVMSYNPSAFASCGADCPVERVTWAQVAGTGGFVEKLNQYLQSTGQPWAGKVRLPTEAEWEYAARAGTTTRFPWGDVLECEDSCAACSAHEEEMWWCGNAAGVTHPAQQKAANPWGFHDMLGNVWEWVADYFGTYPSEAQTDPKGPATGDLRVMRGGEWWTWAAFCRSASRSSAGESHRSSHVGFRVAITP